MTLKVKITFFMIAELGLMPLCFTKLLIFFDKSKFFIFFIRKSFFIRKKDVSLPQVLKLNFYY